MRISHWLIWAVTFTLLSTSASGQEGVRELIKQAYGRTQGAKSVEDFSSIIDLCQQAQGKQPNAASADYLARLLSWAFNRRGELYVEQAAAAEEGDLEAAAALDRLALADFEAATQHDPQHWKAFHNRGVSYALTGQHQQAITDFTRVLELKNDYVNAWFNRAEIYYETGQFQQAVADYSRAIALQPNDPAAFTNRGHAHLRQNDFAAAVADYTKAIQLDERNAEAYLNRGEAYQSERRWAEAAADFRQAIALDPQSPWGYQSAAWLMATCPDERFRNPELGVQAAERAKELETHYKILDTLAAAYANAGRFEDAVETMQEAIRRADPAAATDLTQRLARYQSKDPYRQPGSSGSATLSSAAEPGGLR